MIERKGMKAPFIPTIKQGEVDTSNFSDQFTKMSMGSSFENEKQVNRFSEHFAEEA